MESVPTMGNNDPGMNNRELWLEQFSHQLIAPLSGLEATADQLVRNYETWDDTRILSQLRNLQSMARWAARLARNISWQARSGPLTDIGTLTQWIHLKPFLIDCIRDIEGFTRSRGIAIQVEDTIGESWEILISTELFKQAILNLLDNAVKYAHMNTRVTIRASISSNSSLIISITNYGIPISKDDVGNIFQRGFRTRAAVEQVVVGTGTGLSVAREILQLHHGDVILHSSEPKLEQKAYKVTFDVILPQSSIRT